MRPLLNQSRQNQPNPDPHHGSHTLRVWSGTVVALFGNDVFVELGPRMQGVISIDHFPVRPEVDSVHEFTLRGLEEGLWSLALSTEKTLTTWKQMEIGCLVQARCVRVAPGGLEVKIGDLHGFMPKSHTGLARDQRPDPLVGKHMTVEVIEIDSERQRVTVSRKLVVQRERLNDHQREVDRLKIGQVVQGRVTRVVDFGAFVAIRPGIEGLVPASESGVGPTQRLRGVLQPGQKVSARILAIDMERERLALSFLHGSGLRIQPEEAENADSFEGIARSLGKDRLESKLGDALGRALRRDAG